MHLQGFRLDDEAEVPDAGAKTNEAVDQGVGEEGLEGSAIREPYENIGYPDAQDYQHDVHGEPEAPLHQLDRVGVGLVDVGAGQGDDRGDVIPQRANDENQVGEELQPDPSASG